MRKNKFPGLILPLIFGILTTNGFAQKQGADKIDSLKTVLDNYVLKCNKACIEDSEKVILLNKIGWEYKFVNSDSALKFGIAALQFSKNIYWQSGVAQSYHQIASFFFNRGDYFISLNYSDSALNIWETLEKTETEDHKNEILLRKSKTLGNMGITYDKLNNYKKTLDCYFRALKIAEVLGNEDGIATKLGNIGGAYFHYGEFSKAIDYYFKSVKMDEKIGNKNRMGAFLGNMGLAFYKIGDTAKAIEYYNKSLNLNSELDNKKYISRDLMNLGIIYEHKKNYHVALANYVKALKIGEELGDKSGIAISLSNIGSLYLDLGKFKEAEEKLNQSIEILEKINEYSTLHDNFINLSSLYEKTGRYKMALEIHKKATQIKDSLFNKEKTQEITRKEMNYEFDKRETETKAEQDRKDAIVKGELEKQKLIRNSIASGAGIISLSAFLSFIFYKRKRDAVQLQKETALSLQVSETEMKALRSQMNPHFIFNALQSIQTFLMSHQSEEANTYLIKFSKLMRAVLENSQHREISLQKDMQALELYMQLESIRLQHPFTFQFHIDESVDMEETTIPPLILQPFVENAIWHGLQYKTEPGHINIYITKRDNALHAIVEDNGVGRDLSKQVNQPMLLKKESLGMKLTEERLKILNELKKIKAQFKITDLFTKENVPAGTRVELSLPLAI